jgi:hypothetical protein
MADEGDTDACEHGSIEIWISPDRDPGVNEGRCVDCRRRLRRLRVDDSWTPWRPIDE